MTGALTSSLPAATMTEALLRSLHAPTRNRYFYGKLLDVRHFQMEQAYGLDKRWLLNRLGLGAGVLCGLAVTAGTDGTICIAPGVAVDALGREIVVPNPVVIDPAQPRDDNGLPVGDRLTDGTTTIRLCYTECATDPTLVSVSECDGTAATAAGTVEERFRVLVTAGLPDAPPPALSDAQRDAIFPPTVPDGFDRRVAAEQTLAVTCTAPDASCVVLATVTLPGAGGTLVLDPWTYRPEVFSNAMLFELIAALAARVDACCAEHAPPPAVVQVVSVVSGDAQSAPVDTELPEPVTLLVADGDGNPVAAAALELTVSDLESGLSLDGVTFAPTLTASTGADGTLAFRWRLGSTAGAYRADATPVAGGATVAVSATATPVDVPVVPPPVLVRLVPENASSVPADWAREPSLRLGFDQAMTGAERPDDWLRAWFFESNADGVFGDGKRIRIRPGEPAEGDAAAFAAERIDTEQCTVLVIVRGSAPEIVATADGVALDADFAGTRLTPEQVERIWESDDVPIDPDLRAALSDGGAALPSGDGTAGGFGHAFFTVRLPQ